MASRQSDSASKGTSSKRGFAAMDPAKQREIASKGGKASHGGGRPSKAASAAR
jgi:general stress protein YciG